MSNFIKFSTRVFPYPSGSVCVRVRWNKKRCSVEMTTGDYVELSKWDSTAQRAKTNTKHSVHGVECTSSQINNHIRHYLERIETVFERFSESTEMPDAWAFRAAMKDEAEKELVATADCMESRILETMGSILNKFLAERSVEYSLKYRSCHKYKQVIRYLLEANPHIRIDQIDKNALMKLKAHFIKKKRHNDSIVRWFSALLTVLNWAKSNGYPVKNEALNFKHHIFVPEKQIIYVRYEELLYFYRFQFPPSVPDYIVKVRDLFCFMAFTSLRYSDLYGLLSANITDSYLKIYTQKTHDYLQIPLVSFAKDIYERRGNPPSCEKAFNVPTNQVMNRYIKIAAKEAGLSREVVESYFVDKVRYDKVTPLWQTLSCHDARRTFVCCSLKLRISPTIVMKCTGHSKYEKMKPYIAVADDTVAEEMMRWEREDKKEEISKLLGNLNDETLEDLYLMLKGYTDS